MARTINAGETQVKREEIFGLDPKEVVYDIRENTRWHANKDHPLNHEKVVEYARQFADPTIGQLQPIVVRTLPDKRVKVVAGFHRLAAALLVRNGDEGAGITAIPDFRVRCKVVDVNEAQGVRLGIIENKARNGTSVMDDADNLVRLRTICMDSDEDICRILNIDKQWLGTLERLNSIPNEFKLLVHNRTLSVKDVLALAALPDDKQVEALREAIEASGGQENFNPVLDASIQSGVAATVERHALSTAAANKAGVKLNKKKLKKSIRAKNEAAGVKQSLSRGEMLSFFKFMEQDEEASEGEKFLAEMLLSWAAGKRGDQSFRNQLDKVLKKTPTA